MKIAAVSDDGTTISPHFGRAGLYVVVTVEDGKVVGTETRPKSGHHSFAGHGEQHGCQGHDAPHGHGQGAQARHTAMIGSIEDCHALLARGMGWGAYEALHERGIDAVITDVPDVREAALLYAKNELPNLRERLH
jgi:predicted Fe-Mo cluster-binding NifX family protein